MKVAVKLVLFYRVSLERGGINTEECEVLFVVDWKAHVDDLVRVAGG